MRYRWLHISDLHSICSGIRTEIMREALIKEIEDLKEQAKFNFLLITGDISDKNKGYDEAKGLIHKIIKAMRISTENVYMVPGNHDVDREVPPNREKLVKESWDQDLLDDYEETLSDILLQGQRDFFIAYEDILGRKYPVDKLHFIKEFDDNVAIIHFNTSWICFDSKNESGKLHIGLKQANACLHDETLNSKSIKIAIGHHRISDFNKVVGSHLKSILKTTDVDFYLGGHCHTSTIDYDLITNTEFCSCRQARAEEKDYPAGFIIGDINTESDQSHMRFYGWNCDLAKWTYDYTVESTKHGKYYLQSEKFTKEPATNRDVIVDLKLWNVPIEYDSIIDKFKLKNAAIYNSSIRNVRPESKNEWEACLRELKNIYESIIKDSNKIIHIFPLASIPLLVTFGYLIQNDSNNVKIYQYYENKNEWVFDEVNDEIEIKSNMEINGIKNKKLAVTLNISASVENPDVKLVLGSDYDLLSIGIDDPKLSKLNYYADVQRVKNVLKDELDGVFNKYEEIHLFLAAPAGLCVEVGRIIRENMYPDTYVYNYERSSEPKYKQIFNLKKIRNI